MADIDGSGKPAIILAPLMGRDSSAKGNWMDGRPVRILAFPIPKDAIKGPWEPKVLSDSLHVVHNIWPLADRKQSILVACLQGVVRLDHDGKDPDGSKHLVIGRSDQKGGLVGASEVKPGRLLGNRQFVASIEPWHGNQVVV